MRKHTLAALLMGCILLLLPAAAQAELPDENGEGFLGTTFETMRREIQEGERDAGILLYVQLSSIEEYRERLAEGEILDADSFGYCVNTLAFQVYSTVYGEWEGDALTLMASVSPRDFSPAGRYLIQIKEETPKLHYPLVPGFLPEAGDYTLIQWYPVDALGRVYAPTGYRLGAGGFPGRGAGGGADGNALSKPGQPAEARGPKLPIGGRPLQREHPGHPGGREGLVSCPSNRQRTGIGGLCLGGICGPGITSRGERKGRRKPTAAALLRWEGEAWALFP